MFSSGSDSISGSDDVDFSVIQRKSQVKLSNRIGQFLASPITNRSVPIVYRSQHNIGFLKIEELHPFDSKKFEKIAKFLVEDRIVQSSKCYLKARKVTDETLRKLHTQKYVDKMKTSEGVAQVIEFPLAAAAPFWLVRNVIVNPMKYQVGGTILAGELAMKFGWSINLGGGMHHCSYDRGGGWCAFGDIQLSIINLREQKLIKKSMIIDLDCHQGNGHERDKIGERLGKKEDVFIIDIFRHGIYPGDWQAGDGINIDIDVTSRTTDKQYTNRLQRALDKAFEKFTPDIVYYNAGTDILEGDPLGGLKISSECVIVRDRLVFEECLRRNIPIVMVTSGGYQKTNGRIIADSIKNLEEKLKIMEFARKNFEKNSKVLSTIKIEKEEEEEEQEGEGEDEILEDDEEASGNKI